MNDLKQFIRPALAIIWSLASIITYIGTGQNPPEWMLALTGTCVLWFYTSREIEKRRLG